MRVEEGYVCSIHSYLHLAIDPGKNSLDFGINSGLVFPSTAIPPTRDPQQVPTAVRLTDQRSTTVALENTGHSWLKNSWVLKANCIFSLYTCGLTVTAHLTGILASLQFTSTDHVFAHSASIHMVSVTLFCINDAHSHFHQIIRDSACIGKTMCSLIVLTRL